MKLEIENDEFIKYVKKHGKVITISIKKKEGG